MGPPVLRPGNAQRDDALLAELPRGVRPRSPTSSTAADDEKWDAPIVEAMEVAYAFGGPKTQTPTIVVRADPPHGFKGPVMAPAPTGEAAVRMWDAIQVLSRGPRVLRDHPAPPQSAAHRNAAATSSMKRLQVSFRRSMGPRVKSGTISSSAPASR